MSEFPRLRLGDICEKITDGTHHSPVNLPQGQFKYITAKNIKAWGMDLGDLTYVDEATHREIYARCDVRKDDILYVKDGATTGTAIVNPLDEEFSLLSSVAVLRPGPALKPKYLLYALQEPNTKAKMMEGVAGVAITRLTLTKLAGAEIPVAPLKTQERIVAKLEELLSDLDVGVAELKAAQTKLAVYRQSLLKSAVEGALTAEWRAKNPPIGTSAQLLERILTERRVRWEAKQLAKFKERGKTPPKDWHKKYPEPVQLNPNDLPALPEGWVWTSLDQLISESSYGTSVKCDYGGDGTPVLRIPNVRGGRLDLRDMKFSVANLDLDRSDYLAVGDVLVIRTNGSISLVGQAAVVITDLPSPHYFASYLLRLRATETTFIHRWIVVVLSASSGRQWIEARAASSAGQHNISLSTLLFMPVPLPPLDEQSLLLSELQDGEDSIGRQEATIEISLKQSTAQRQNILRAAFTGQLVPQDPSDESASVLLERIRFELPKRTKQSKPRKIKTKGEIAVVIRELRRVLAEAGDWLPAQEAFRRCGVADGAQTEQIEALYAELRVLDKAGLLQVEAATDEKGRKLYDRLKLTAD